MSKVKGDKTKLYFDFHNCRHKLKSEEVHLIVTESCKKLLCVIVKESKEKKKDKWRLLPAKEPYKTYI